MEISMPKLRRPETIGVDIDFGLFFYVVYDSPSDYPGKVISRYMAVCHDPLVVEEAAARGAKVGPFPSRELYSGPQWHTSIDLAVRFAERHHKVQRQCADATLGITKVGPWKDDDPVIAYVGMLDRQEWINFQAVLET